MSHVMLNPDGLHDPIPFGYSHTVAIPAGTELVLVAGQYGSNTDGAVVSPDFTEQVQQASATWVSPWPPMDSTSAMSPSSGRTW